MKAGSSCFSIPSIAIVALVAICSQTCHAQYVFTSPPGGDDTVEVFDNATYPHYFYTLAATGPCCGLRFFLATSTPNNAGFQVNAATGQVYVDAAKANFFPPLQFELHKQYVCKSLELCFFF